MDSSLQSEPGSLEREAGTSQYLTFMLGGEEYAIDILKVQEIRSWEPVTGIPNTPDYVLGVVNLRGTIVPVIDLRRRFSLDKADFDATTVVIVVKIKNEDKFRTVGMVADTVSEVYNVPKADIRPTPDLGGVISTEYIKGLATIDDKMIILLEIDVLVNSGILEELPADV